MAQKWHLQSHLATASYVLHTHITDDFDMYGSNCESWVILNPSRFMLTSRGSITSHPSFSKYLMIEHFLWNISSLYAYLQLKQRRKHPCSEGIIFGNVDRGGGGTLCPASYGALLYQKTMHTRCLGGFLISVYQQFLAKLHFSGTEGNFIDTYINNW